MSNNKAITSEVSVVGATLEEATRNAIYQIKRADSMWQASFVSKAVSELVRPCRPPLEKVFVTGDANLQME